MMVNSTVGKPCRFKSVIVFGTFPCDCFYEIVDLRRIFFTPQVEVHFFGQIGDIFNIPSFGITAGNCSFFKINFNSVGVADDLSLRANDRDGSRHFPVGFITPVDR